MRRWVVVTTSAGMGRRKMWKGGEGESLRVRGPSVERTTRDRGGLWVVRVGVVEVGVVTVWTQVQVQVPESTKPIGCVY